MKNQFKFALLFILGLTVISCKDKAPEATDATEVASTEGAQFSADTTATVINWTGSKPAGTHAGTIKITEGSIFVKDSVISAGSFTINMNSITVTDLQGEEKASLEAHLKGTGSEGAEDFFNVTKFPTAKFEIASVVPATDIPNANANVTGNLTILDVTKSVTFPANVTINGDNVTVVTPQFSINRTDFGIKYGSKTFFDNLKDKFIEDNILLQINLSANKAAM